MKYFTVNHSTTVEELKSHYRQLSKRMHPDHGGSHNEFVAMSEEFQNALRLVATQSRSTTEKHTALEFLDKIRPFLGKPISTDALFAIGSAFLSKEHMNVIGRILNELTKEK